MIKKLVVGKKNIINLFYRAQNKIEKKKISNITYLELKGREERMSVNSWQKFEEHFSAKSLPAICLTYQMMSSGR